MGRRGRPVTVDHCKRLALLREFEIFDSDLNLKPESNPVWDAASECLGLTKRNLFLYVKQNRKLVTDNLIENSGSYQANPTTVECTENYNENEVENESSEEESFDDSFSEEECLGQLNIKKLDYDENQSQENGHVLHNLRQMKVDIEFKKCIRLLCLDNFYLMYWSQEQIMLYNTISKKIEYLEIFLMKDCVNKIVTQMWATDEIDFYAVVGVKGAKERHAFCQMLSSRSGSRLCLFLSEWIRSGASIPTSIFCPSSFKIISDV